MRLDGIQRRGACLCFPECPHYHFCNRVARNENPNIRSKNTYWRENWEAVQDQVETFENEYQLTEGITMHHTGGHSDGHSVIVLEDGGETAVHFADLMPTNAHKIRYGCWHTMIIR